MNWTLRNKLQWNLNQNSNIFIQENVFESVVCEMAAILSRPQCVKRSFIVQNKQWRTKVSHCGQHWASWCPYGFGSHMTSIQPSSSGYSTRNHMKLRCPFYKFRNSQLKDEMISWSSYINGNPILGKSLYIETEPILFIMIIIQRVFIRKKLHAHQATSHYLNEGWPAFHMHGFYSNYTDPQCLILDFP